MRTSPSFPHPTWLSVKAKFTPSTLRTSSTSTSQMALRLSSLPARSSRAQIGHPDRSSRISHVTKQSEERNIRSVLEAPSHLDLPRGTLALSPPAPAFPDRSPVQVKREEISLQTLRQSLSLRKVRVKKESRSPSPRILLGPPRRQRSLPRQQSLTYVTPPPNFLRRLHRRHRREAARALAPLVVRPAEGHNNRLCPRSVLRPPRRR